METRVVLKQVWYNSTCWICVHQKKLNYLVWRHDLTAEIILVKLIKECFQTVKQRSKRFSFRDHIGVLYCVRSQCAVNLLQRVS